MQLAKLIVEARYQQIPDPMQGINAQLARVFSEQLPKGQIPAELPIQLRHELKFPKDQVVFGLDAHRMGVDVDRPNGPRHAAALAIAYLDKGQEVARLNEIDRFGIRTIWMAPEQRSFSELVQIMRTRWLGQGSKLYEAASDLSVALVLDDDGRRVNVTWGPIRPEELPRWAVSATETFVSSLLVDVDYAHIKKGEYKDLARKDRIEAAIDYALNIADQVESELRGEAK